jgi:hypothetical protein
MKFFFHLHQRYSASFGLTFENGPLMTMPSTIDGLLLYIVDYDGPMDDECVSLYVTFELTWE